MEYVFHKVKSIGIVDNHTLIAQFEDGLCKTYDMNQLLDLCDALNHNFLDDIQIHRKMKSNLCPRFEVTCTNHSA